MVCQFKIWGNWILLFEDNGCTTTVTARRYVAKLEFLFEPQLACLAEEQDFGNIWFQQYKATAHTAQISMTKLR